MIVPYDRLKPDVLQALIEEFVTRDGTDYGEAETDLQTRVQQVEQQIKDRNAVVVFDPTSQTCNIMLVEDVPSELK